MAVYPILELLGGEKIGWLTLWSCFAAAAALYMQRWHFERPWQHRAVGSGPWMLRAAGALIWGSVFGITIDVGLTIGLWAAATHLLLCSLSVIGVLTAELTLLRRSAAPMAIAATPVGLLSLLMALRTATQL